MVCKFVIGQEYRHTDWFTGGMSEWRVTERDADTVGFSVVRHELDGVHRLKEIMPVIKDADGNERCVLYTYKGEECAIYADPSDTEFTLKTGAKIRQLKTYRAIRQYGSITKGAAAKVTRFIAGPRICIDTGGYALTEDEFISAFGENPDEII